jgi:tetratricopeptide (TPR) repeat protein
MRRYLTYLAMGLLFSGYLFISMATWENRSRVRQETRADFVLPSRFSRILAFGYKGLLSDFQFLKLTTFLGERTLHQKKILDEDWRYFKSSVESITDLDPYFLDPYFLAEGFLTWEAGQYEEANRLLEKGVQYRTWDWRLPYFVGFNYFYFLRDNEKGADYVMKAARIPGSPDYLPTLGARLAYYGGKAETGILFLKGMLANTTDPNLRKTLQLRLLALERAALIEEAVHKFQEENGRFPGANELVSRGYLEELPEDPYGGRWGIMENGRVFSTSRFTVGKGNSSNQPTLSKP